MLTSKFVVRARRTEEAIARIPGNVTLVPRTVIVVTKGGREGLYLVAS